MGQVYLAQDLHQDRQVALKILAPQLVKDQMALRRFQREGRAAGSLHHPNICMIHEVGDVDGTHFISMEYCPGMLLRQRLNSGRMSIPETLDVGIQVADALEEAHKHKIVHRDIKPENIIILPRGQLKILDFGLAKLIPEKTQDASGQAIDTPITESGGIVGTIDYMSPEQLLSKKVDRRTDIFSLGVVLYEMLTGRCPFRGDSMAEVLDAILHEEPVSIARFNEDAQDSLIRVVRKMLRKNPEERYQSIHGVCIDLRGNKE